MKSVVYFAYGSNLDEGQMRKRCPAAEALGTATLRNHALTFGGFSHKWSGAVASVRRQRGAIVEGLLYRLPAEQLDVLDRHEGHPFSYERVTRVVDSEVGRVRALVYLQPEDSFEAWAPQPRYVAVLCREYVRRGFAIDQLFFAAGNPS